ncbi:MAG: helix-turn-helix transcriptional regulator [Lachnospiraceae bacterium]|nr:helix-turn-helix transcriptional regulator [Lachnospiraceae bacterium]
MFDKRKFQAQMVLMGINGRKLSEMLNINESTLSRKLNDDGNFSREEINKLIEILHIDNPKDIFFAETIAETQN